MNENFDLESHLRQQIFPPLPLAPLINVALPPKTPPMSPQSFQTTLSEGREGKHFCDLVGVSMQGKREIRALTASVSTSFVQDWRLLLLLFFFSFLISLN